MKLIPLALASAIAVTGCASMQAPSPAAEAAMKATQGNSVNGTVSFVQKGEQLLVEARLEGLTPGLHGFHIHEKGDCSAPDASSAGGHFNPSGKQHGDPAHAEHHGGDFGNLTADANGKALLQLSIPTSQITLVKDAPNSIIGRGLIVHADPDDYMTQPTGNSGKRLACGVIGLK
ncbi:MAG: superoxide dismutase family protein [Pseudomonadota bacterium]